ncbi:hypothetical protein J2S74_003029 [Evansella vedderi]|uniref:Restriction endonuclease n=1 Tax=Evansella vedderi TaxID=38282 RepID=A0ABT9ZWP0_9BACI|nr:hypothetical protein [Evansella vedderi]MDQ0255647.1 hypothetical protein [Evansella vedderi]
MFSEKFNWTPKLPIYNKEHAKSFIKEVNELLNQPNGLKEVVEYDLQQNVQLSKIKRFKRIDTYNKTDNYDKIGLADFNSKKYFILDDLGYEISIPHSSPLKPIEPIEVKHRNDWKEHDRLLKQLSKDNRFITVKKPWKIVFETLKVKSLKTQDNVQVRFSLGIDTSLVDVNIQDPTTCNHEFRLFYNGIWNWRLVWECLHCGFLCHCKCFESAIWSSQVEHFHKTANIDKIKQEKGKDISDLPFYEGACEVCRGVPSTHQFCHEMYARSEFELRYGAYVRKKAYELKLLRPELEGKKELEREANNIVREELGFRKIGQRFVTETELYRIVKSLFPEQEVIHHYRVDWLEQQELDIFIPSLNLGIEYHGEQHYKAIDAWGGEEGLSKNKYRDKLKEEKCKNNGVYLVVFSYDEKPKLSSSYVKAKLKRQLKVNSLSEIK